MATNNDLQDADRQDIRLAVVLNGGVSLAVWIGGVTVELHRLVQASRAPAGEREQDAYAGLLDVLGARARIDVIAGTSAGGLNGGFLALGLVHGCDLAGMRQMWADEGDLGVLLRDPRTKDSPSLLRGDYFHQALKTAYGKIAGARTGRRAPEDDFVELYLTGTLWDGRRSPFTDELGRGMVEVDHDATFHFSSDPRQVPDGPPAPGQAVAGDLGNPAVADQLAVASRCTSSFPGAFEPFRVSVGNAVGDRWESSGGLVNFAVGQFVVDGGVLLNKPIRPALDSVYRQSASNEVRRLMAYVVPDPGEASPAAPHEDGPVPRAPDVVLGVLTRLRSTDSVAAELAEIERRNLFARSRRRMRDRLAEALIAAGTADLAASSYDAYREVRIDDAARTIASLLRQGGAAERGWSQRELATMLQVLGAEEPGLPFVPGKDFEEAINSAGPGWRWGQSEVTRLGDLAVDVLKRAVWLAPINSAERAAVVSAREQLHGVLAEIRADADSLSASWRALGRQLPQRSTLPVATPAELTTLHDRLRTALTQWEGDDPGAKRAALHGQALRVAGCLLSVTTALQDISQSATSRVDRGIEERSRLAALVRALVVGASTDPAVLHNMLLMQVLHVAFSGGSTQVEQEVELVQVSSMTPTLLTGVQQHHFGAFYRTSWRLNDWLRGRLDGAAQLVQMLLDPERLRQLEMSSPQAYDALRAVAVGPETSPWHSELQTAWDSNEVRLRQELAVLDGTGPLPRTFPLASERIAERISAAFLPDELKALARAVRLERDPLVLSSQWAGVAERSLLAGADSGPSLGDVQAVLESSAVIGEQRISDEMTEATDTFARTITHVLATVTSMLTSVRRPRLVASTLASIRGYAVLVWVLVNSLTSRANIGSNLVSLTLGLGGALLGLSLVVPGVPVGVTLAGAVLVLAAATATALARRRQYGRFWVRLLVPLGLVLAAFAGEVFWALSSTHGDALRKEFVGWLVRSGAVLAVVVVGWLIARAKPRKGNP